MSQPRRLTHDSMHLWDAYYEAKPVASHRQVTCNVSYSDALRSKVQHTSAVPLPKYNWACLEDAIPVWHNNGVQPYAHIIDAPEHYEQPCSVISFGTKEYDYSTEALEQPQEELLEEDYLDTFDVEDDDWWIATPYEIAQFRKKAAEQEHAARVEKTAFKTLLSYAKKAYDYVKPVKVRDGYLLTKLRIMIVLRRQQRTPRMMSYYGTIINKIIAKYDATEVASPIVPEGDVERVEGKNEVITDTGGNVTLTHQEQPSTAVTDPPSMQWSHLTTCDTVSAYSQVADRWYNVGTYDWTTDQKTNHDLAFTRYKSNTTYVKRKIILPLDVVHMSDENPCDMPNLMPFRVNAYWRGDIIVKLQVNSNKFQVGALLMTFIPQASTIDNIELRDNVFSLSQLPHSVVMASASNEAELYIPYSHPYPYLPCRPMIDFNTDHGVLNLGTLYVKVLNPLVTVTDGPAQCSVSLYVKFVNNSFTGLSHGSLFKYPNRKLKVEPEMDVLGIGAAMALLDQVAPNHNRDLPPVNRDPQYMVPTASHTWCAGTGQAHHTQILRLDTAGQTHHPKECATREELNVSTIARKFGLIDQIQFGKPTDAPKGHLLASYDAMPFLSQYTSGTGYGEQSAYAPVGSVAALFMQWRGTLEFKFQFVASQFHTGRVVVGYVPGIDSDTTMTLNKLRASTHVVFDLQEQREFTFEVPFISYKPWFTRDFGGNFVDAGQPVPSRVYMYVLNPLINMPSIPDHVAINVYLRGGTSFEVSVPVQSALGLGINSEFKFSNQEEVIATKGYYPYYGGVWHSIGDGNCLVFRWGTLSDQIAEFNSPIYPASKDVAYYFELKDKTLAPKVGSQQKPVHFMVMASMGNYWIGLPMENEEKAKMVCVQLQLDKLSLSSSVVIKNLWHVDTTTSDTWCIGNPIWVRRNIKRVNIFEIIEPEGEETASASTLTAPSHVVSTQFGKYLYGESFNDLRNLCRRYQFYGRVYIGDFKTWDGNKCLFYMPALPQGLQLDLGDDNSINELSNRCREGHIPYLASAFRYYRGGLRFKIVMPNEVNTMVWVQHRPDRRLSSYTIQNCNSIESAQGIWNHTYASYLQYTRVNNIIEFEVPFYNATAYNFLQRMITNPENAFLWAISLGEIGIGCQLANEDINTLRNKEVMIYYSLADDCTFSHWIGFPPMFTLDVIPTVQHMRIMPEGPEKIYPEGMFSKIIDTQTKEVKEKVVEEAKDTIKDEFKTLYDVISTKLAATKINVDPSHISTIVSQIGHAIINPTWQTMAWCVASILLTVGLFTMATFKYAFDVCKKVMSTIFTLSEKSKHPVAQTTVAPEVPSQESTSDKIVPEAPLIKDTKDVCAEWIGVLYNGLVTAMGLCVKKPKNLSQWTSFLVKDVGNTARSSNQIILFIRNTFDAIKSLFFYILGKTDRTHKTLQQLEGSPEVVKAWAKEVTMLTDPTTKNQRLGHFEYNNRVSEAANMAQIIMADLAGDIKTQQNSQALSKLYDKIIRLQEELIQMGENPFVRRMPYAVYVYGAPGIGKSFMTSEIMTHMLKQAKIKPGAKGIKCTINPLSEFWDQCEHQPILECDDMWAVSTDQAIATQLLTLLQVMSPIVLSPPKAALEEKKMRYNPDIFWMTSNKDFPTYNNVLPEVIWRRRNILVKVALKDMKSSDIVHGCPHCEGKDISEIDPKWLADYHHLEFFIHTKPKDSKAPYGPSLRFRDFKKYIIQDFLDFRTREHENFCQRIATCEMLNSDYPIIVGDSIEKIYQKVHEERLAKYAKLESNTLWHDVKHCGIFVFDKIVRSKRWLIGNSATVVKPEYGGPKNPSEVKQGIIKEQAQPEENKTMPLTVKCYEATMTPEQLAAKKALWERESDISDMIVDKMPPHPDSYQGRLEALAAYREQEGIMVPLALDIDAPIVPEGDEVDKSKIAPKATPIHEVNLREINKHRSIFQKILSIFSGVTHVSIDAATDTKYAIPELVMLMRNEIFSPREYVRLLFVLSTYDIDHANTLAFWKNYSNALSELATNTNTIKSLYEVFQYLYDCVKPQHIGGERYKVNHDPYCYHMKCPLEETTVNIDRHIMYKDIDLSVPCGEKCIFKNVVLKSLWYRIWLNAHPLQNSKYRNGKYECLPEFLGQKIVFDTISVDTWYKTVIQELKDAWRKNVSQPVYKVFQWVCERMPVILGVIMSVVALGSIGSAIYFNKSISENTANVIGEIQRNVIPGNEISKNAALNKVAMEGLTSSDLIEASTFGALATGAVTGVMAGHKLTQATNAIRYETNKPQALHNNVTPQMVFPQSGAQYHCAVDRINNNAFYIVATFDNEVIVKFRGLILYDRVALVLRHYVEACNAMIEKNKAVQLTFEYVNDNKTRCPRRVELKMDAVKAMYYGFKEGKYFSNYVLICLPGAIPAAKSLLPFISQSDKLSVLNRQCDLLVPGGQTYVGLYTHLNNVPIVISATSDSTEVKLMAYYQYARHGYGMCGSILLDPTSGHPIIGMHVAGGERNGGIGFAEPLHSISFKDISMGTVRGCSDFASLDLDPVTINSVPLSTTVFPVGIVSAQLGQHQSRKTKIVKSLIHGVFPVETEPNPLSGKDPRISQYGDPLYLGCDKHGIPTSDFPSVLLDAAQQSLSMKLLSACQPIRVKIDVFTREIAICGHPSIKEIECINLDTSAGYPLKSRNMTTGKRSLFDLTLTDEGYKLNSIDAELKHLIDLEMDMRKQGIVPATVFSDCLKDTTQILEKNLKPGKTRIFSISPVQYTIVFRQYMLDFMAAYRRHRFDCEHAIGINVNGPEWTCLAGQITQLGKHIITGDYSNFGPGLNKNVAAAAFECILSWYDFHSDEDNKQENQIIRGVLCQEILNAYHLCERLVYQTSAGIPSGSPITDILNSLVNCLYMRVAFQAITGKNVSEFEQYVYLIVYGDDLVMNVRDDIVDVFNNVTLQKFFARYNIGYTDTDKTGKIVPFKQLHEITFLKHKFVQHPTRPFQLLAELDETSVNSCANWIRASGDPREATAVNVLQCLELAYGLGPIRYKEKLHRLIRWCTATNIKCTLPTWDIIDQRVWDLDALKSYAIFECDQILDYVTAEICSICNTLFLKPTKTKHLNHGCINKTCKNYNRRLMYFQNLEYQFH